MEHSAQDIGIVVRKPQFDFRELPVLWFGQNTFLTFFCNSLNLTFPLGERCFVYSVRQAVQLTQDPRLREQVRLFSSQEGQHARAHERLISAISQQGFSFHVFFGCFGPYTRWTRRFPVKLQIAITAALEHYTALLAESAFGTGVLDGVQEPMKGLLIWHCTEELEHRSVAYDVMQAAGVGYVGRLLGLAFATLSISLWTTAGLCLFARQSRTAWRTIAKDFLLAQDLLASSRLVVGALRYLRPGFHPAGH